MTDVGASATGPSTWTRAVKRAIDMAAAAAGLVLLMPMFIVIAAAIRIDGPGPVFFAQQRVGRGGRPFAMLKFRSMVVDAARRGGLLTVGNDPRVTRVGAVLRRHKLDELPQLVNVLLGHMSLVGPRPEVPRLMALYPREQAARICTVRPGVTDSASLLLRNESALLQGHADPEQAYRCLILPIKYAHCDRYIREMGLATDLRLIAATVALLAFGRGPRLDDSALATLGPCQAARVLDKS